MKNTTFAIRALTLTLCAGMLLSASTSCTSLKNTWNGMSQTGQGATAGGAAGAAAGAGIGAIIGGGKGTWIGALVGSALGAGTGALIGNSMDRQKKQLEEQLASVKELESKRDTTYIVETVKDRNNLDAIKLVMGDAVLFATGKYSLTPAAQAALSRVAYNLKSVVTDLENNGIPAARLKAVGDGWNNPIASNATAAGRAQNRRVEIYITANQQMIQQAQNTSR